MRFTFTEKVGFVPPPGGAVDDFTGDKYNADATSPDAGWTRCEPGPTASRATASKSNITPRNKADSGLRQPTQLYRAV